MFETMNLRAESTTEQINRIDDQVQDMKEKVDFLYEQARKKQEAEDEYLERVRNQRAVPADGTEW